MSLPAHVLRHAAERPDAVALRDKHLGRWRETTWKGYAERIARAAGGLRALGVAPGDRVAIHAENRVEWVIADLAIQALGAITVGVYPTSPEAEVAYLLAHAGVKVHVVEDEEQLDKALAVRGQVPDLEQLVVMDPRGVREEGLVLWADLEAAEPIDLEAACAELQPEATAILVYTSGTTGPPKGAMISHANLDYAGGASGRAFGTGPSDSALSYLPLCHVAERLLSVVDAVHAGYVVHFGEGPETFPQDLREVQPTVFLGVPRVWEKMLAGVQTRMGDATWLKRTVYARALEHGQKQAAGRMAGRTPGPVDRFWSAVLYRPLREKLGLLRVRAAISGAAPIAPQVLEWFWALGVPIREAYGMTENTAQCTFTTDDVRIGWVGTALEGVELRIAEDGEILTRSAGVFQGYWKNPEATAETVDPDGWLHTGDVGVLSDDGFLKITDRKKDIMITAGGKNIAPSEIENRLKVSPYVREAIVLGDGRKHLAALIGIEGDTVGDWAGRRGLAFTTYADLAGKPEVRALVQEHVDAVNAELAQVEQIKKFTLLAKELDHEDGELTATQKVKRSAIAKQFSDEVEALYA
ncbi:MAG: fadD [Solirubrobacterales bacterium]|nr:fadD [Solirubrobacterales bacterium]